MFSPFEIARKMEFQNWRAIAPAASGELQPALALPIRTLSVCMVDSENLPIVGDPREDMKACKLSPGDNKELAFIRLLLWIGKDPA